jgi:hypothetical protein
MNGKLSCRACNRSAVVVTLPFAPYRQSRCDLARHRGYQMLSKMGYEPSQGIGAGGGGRIAPVETRPRSGGGSPSESNRLTEAGVDPRACRMLASCSLSSGGCTACVTCEQMRAADAKRARLQEEAHSAFLQSQAAIFSTRQAESNVVKARKVRPGTLAMTYDVEAPVSASDCGRLPCWTINQSQLSSCRCDRSSRHSTREAACRGMTCGFQNRRRLWQKAMRRRQGPKQTQSRRHGRHCLPSSVWPMCCATSESSIVTASSVAARCV